MTVSANSRGLVEVLGDVTAVLRDLQRDDLASRLEIAASRIRRPSTVMCVVGEFKQGKSSLVNAIVGGEWCPVDDDLATSAITLLRHSDEPRAMICRRNPDHEGSRTERVPVSDVRDWVSEAGNPGNRRGVERVEIGIPSPLLSQGLVLVDTPGVGGLGAGHAAATLAFLPFADGVLFASDASAELSAPEVEFLRQAADLCPTVVLVQTKIDLYPEWRRIVALNEGHLAELGIAVPVVPVSSVLRRTALAERDAALNEESRFPILFGRLDSDVLGPAKVLAARRAVTEATEVLTQITAGLASERKVLADPSTIDTAAAELATARARLDHLRGPGAKWGVVLGDRLTDLSNEATFGFRAAVRDISRSADERIEQLRTGQEWDGLARELQSSVAAAVTHTFVQLETGRVDIRLAIAELLRDEEIAVGDGSPLTASLDADALWRGKEIERSGTAKRMVGSAITTIRGAQGGILMFGMLGTFLPTAAGVLIASNPVLLGIGAVFGGIGLVDDRTRKVAARRQAARTQTRQFLDDVQFEMSNQISNLVRDIQRTLRDEFTDRINELSRTCNETLAHATKAAHDSTAEREERMRFVDAGLARIGELQRELQVSDT